MSISFDFTEFRFEVPDQFVVAARCLRVCRYLPRELPLFQYFHLKFDAPVLGTHGKALYRPFFKTREPRISSNYFGA